MPLIYSYQKFITRAVTRTLKLPVDANNTVLATELCTINGLTYVSVQAGATLPLDQPAEIKASIATPTITLALTDQIKAASPHTQLISDRTIEQIRAKYSINDELYLARIGIGASSGIYAPTAAEMQELNDFAVVAEAARQWGREQRALLGL